MAGVVREFTAQTMAPLLNRIEALEQRIAAIPAGEDHGPAILSLKEGIERRLTEYDAALAETVASVDKEIKSRVEALPKPQDGRSPTAEELAPLIALEVSRAVSALPKAKDGEPGPAGRDGIGLAGAVIDRNGDLILTMSNGDQRALGRIVGWDGKDGSPGQDGLGFDDLAVEYDGERTITIKFTRGELVKSFAFEVPIALYRGIHKAGAEYCAGDAVTYSGSLLIARRTTTATPETRDAGDDWQLACKRGRDGKDGKDGAPGVQGPQGLPGRDGFRAA